MSVEIRDCVSQQLTTRDMDPGLIRRMADDAAKDAGDMIGQQAVENLKHQMGTRGVWTYQTALTEVEELIDAMIDRIKERAQDYVTTASLEDPKRFRVYE